MLTGLAGGRPRPRTFSDNLRLHHNLLTVCCFSSSTLSIIKNSSFLRGETARLPGVDANEVQQLWSEDCTVTLLLRLYLTFTLSEGLSSCQIAKVGL